MEPKEIDNKNINWDTETPGALLGKWVIYDYMKCRVVLDERVFPSKSWKYPFIVKNEIGEIYSVYPDQIYPWTEPKPKIQKAFFTYKDSEKDIILEPFSKTKKEAEEICKDNNWELLDWPAKLDRIFEEEE